ncbi:MAG: surface lipoprotein assembly modifier [Pikeienuella sp.]
MTFQKVAAGFGLSICITANFAFADERAGAEDDLRLRQASLFNAMLVAPDDLDLMFQHALTSVELRDYEAAITTLERMLIFNPDLARAKVELGAAYFRLGAYENARYYFQDVLDSHSPPPEVVRRIDVFMSQIEKRTQTSGFSGAATFGVTYSTNANLGPPDSDVLLFGRPALLSGQYVEDDDIGFRATLQGRHFHDLGRPNDDVWLTDLSAYSVHYASETGGDIDSVALQTGPRLSLDEKRFGPKLRPFVSGEVLRAGNDPLYYGVGLGVEFTNTLSEEMNIFAGLESKYRDYDDRGDFDGFEHRAGLGLSYSPDAYSTFSVLGFGETDQAQKGYNTNYELGLRLSALHRYDSGLDFTDRLWSLSGFASAAWRWYDEPDTVVSPTRKRSDLDLRAGVSHVFHLNSGWFVQADADYLNRSSNLSNFDLENFGVGLSMGVTF